jgi:hypothetical protein
MVARTLAVGLPVDEPGQHVLAAMVDTTNTPMVAGCLTLAVRLPVHKPYQRLYNIMNVIYETYYCYGCAHPCCWSPH